MYVPVRHYTKHGVHMYICSLAKNFIIQKYLYCVISFISCHVISKSLTKTIINFMMVTYNNAMKLHDCNVKETRACNLCKAENLVCTVT